MSFLEALKSQKSVQRRSILIEEALFGLIQDDFTVGATLEPRDNSLDLTHEEKLKLTIILLAEDKLDLQKKNADLRKK